MIVDLFAGPGGWSEGIRRLGLTDFGLELDETACNTRYAAGHATWQTDVAAVDPEPFGEMVGLIASPPCQDFSAAGRRRGLAGLHGKLVMEVLRWAHACSPEWIACEQVPAVLPVWKAFALDLEDAGYITWTGMLNAADFGVPQVRHRAILMAARYDFSPPEPTHAANATMGDFFGEPKLPWVRMAEALGWDREIEVNTGRDWKPGWTRETAQKINASERPAPAVTTRTVRQWQLRAGIHRPTAPRDPFKEPAPTLAFGHDFAQWAWERPATTVAGDARLWPPGHKINGDDIRRLGRDAYERYANRAGTEAIRLTPREAAVLQGFPADYPFQGTDTKVVEQIGNAVPPPLAAAIVKPLLRGC